MIPERFYWWIAWKLPVRLVSLVYTRVVAAATTGKYGNTVVPELTAIEAIQRWSRIHGLGGSGADEFYDSNRNRRPDPR